MHRGIATAEPVTESQAALFYADQKGLFQSAYNVTAVVTVTGVLTRDELVNACRRLVAATPAMRMRMGFVGLDGEVGYWFSADLPDVDVFDLPHADTDAARQLIDRVATRQFEPDGGPLVRFVIVHAAPGRAYLGMIFHHLVVDGPSFPRIAKRIGDAIEGTISVEPEHEYVDLVRQIRQLEQRSRESDLEYWHARLPARAGETWWPYDLSAQGRGTTGGHSLTPLPADMAQRLERAAAADGVRVFHLLAAAVHCALPAKTAQRTVISTAASIRPRSESDGLLTGYFINQVPLPAAKRDGETPRRLAVREAPRWRDDLRRRYVSFAELAARATRGEGNQSMLDRVVLSYQTQPRSFAWRGRTAGYAADLRPKTQQEKSDLVIRVFNKSGFMECEVHWSSALPPGAGEQFTEHLLEGLTGV
ncbi:condensation domain-containing protein [Lentzea sp. JNUCC 0626]|uniref:condensation domain-containing protein n=1 Tax=Lentzea sp. JNUCC 0626 TaxID=3367513 RepID=UPI0037494876